MSNSQASGKKVIILGDSNVGKTSIINVYQGLPLSEKNTIAADLIATTVSYKDQKVPISIWDTSGDDRYSDVTDLYLRGSICALLVYDQTRPDTFEKLKQIHQKLKEDFHIRNFLVAANKCDLEETIPFSYAKQWCTQNNIRIIKTSAKDSRNIYNLLLAVGEIVSSQDEKIQKSIDLEVEKVQKISKSCF